MEFCTGQDRYRTGTSVVFSNIFFKYRTDVVQTFVYLYNTCIQTKNTSVVQVLTLGQNLPFLVEKLTSKQSIRKFEVIL